ncbi:uracil-DNA glycosylase [Candidatus Thorarchaeota archaeon]|nr:MAG: uracil-DNA glycosylase [Candidatus Thorarchaeota archaeon]
MSREEELKILHQTINKCKCCPLHSTRINAVSGEGPLDATLFFIGEAPGAQEDETGRPFVGRSGKLLASMIEEIGLSRDEVFITSVLKSRPPNNRLPLSSEIEACRPYVEKQIEIINPRIIVLLGNVAISSMIGPWKVSESHGHFFEANDRSYFMTYHPAAALRFPSVKEHMKQDFSILKTELL